MAKIEKLRKIELELLEHFINVCERENLKYYATHGTLLGAVRDGGFLIWDDDIDVAMPGEDYNKLMFHKEWFGSPYFLKTPLDAGRSHKMKLCKDGTTAFDEPLGQVLHAGGHLGICIDILPLDEIGDSGYYFFANTTIRKDYFEPSYKAKFEHLEINAPCKSRKILSMIYNYWNWPTGAENISPHYWFYDTDTDYSIYVKRYTGWLKSAENKKIYLFGAADSLRIWLEDFGMREQVICTFDNDATKWGNIAFDIPIKNPAEIPRLLEENSILIIASMWHKEIGIQLEEMGITDYYVFLDGLFIDKFKGKSKNG